ncbi:aminotransferase class I/II-fold pyridoxal phosphate-dependent enzyme [uncultured Polaribacter sp.]|uniref:aminotransferase class I/II-fold pyridoxal phosphate-dependent enzyme n=1 Tax=uncultured Polaribacter sp. TaxID=174711 RepID=UPI0026233A60|nr:aminotransferase class I/II-fold pyridoxal phosphate-dependent enzyme [uncultured Polaribacter sp.]
MMSKIWLSPPHLCGEEMKYIQKAFDTNWIAPLGENIDEFENALKKELGTEKEVVCLSSGTAALHLSLILAGVNEGDVVVCQSLTFAASANPIIYQKAIPVFVDSEKDTYNISPIYLEKAIKSSMSKGKKPKAIVVVHLYGMPSKIEEIVAIAKKYDIILIEDGAESLGSSYKGKKCGTFGDFGVLSFNGNKIITTSGGGALICKNKIVKDRAIFLATQAKDEATHYQHSTIGYNYRMSNILAGIGRGQMEVLHQYISLRRSNHQFYKNLFQYIDEVQVLEEPCNNFFSNHWLSVITIDEKQTKFDRESLRIKLLEENIESKPLWKPMHLQPVFQPYLYYGEKISETLFKTGLCLPSGSNLTQTDKLRITKVIVEYFK